MAATIGQWMKELPAGAAAHINFGALYKECKPYPGSQVPLNFKCSCGGSVITEYLFYYGPNGPKEDGYLPGEWGGECQQCGRTYTTTEMKSIASDSANKHWETLIKNTATKPKIKDSGVRLSHTSITTIGDTTVMMVYNTEVVRFNQAGILLDHGGWQTNFTKRRMNQANEMFNLGYKVFQKDGEWFVDYRNKLHKFENEKCYLVRKSPEGFGAIVSTP